MSCSSTLPVAIGCAGCSSKSTGTNSMGSLLRPLIRLLVGFIAIPLFRVFLRRVIHMQRLDTELTKDLEQWVRGSLLLLLATANVEYALFGAIFDQWALEAD